MEKKEKNVFLLTLRSSKNCLWETNFVLYSSLKFENDQTRVDHFSKFGTKWNQTQRHPQNLGRTLSISVSMFSTSPAHWHKLEVDLHNANSSVNNLDAKVAVKKYWKVWDDPITAIGESPQQEGGYVRSTEKQKKSPFSNIYGHWTSATSNKKLEPIIRKHRDRIVLLCDIVIHDSGACAVFPEPGSLVSRKTAEGTDVVAWVPECDGQVAAAIPA